MNIELLINLMYSWNIKISGTIMYFNIAYSIMLLIINTLTDTHTDTIIKMPTACAVECC